MGPKRDVLTILVFALGVAFLESAATTDALLGLPLVAVGIFAATDSLLWRAERFVRRFL